MHVLVYSTIVTMPLFRDFICCDGSVRLANGTLSNEGRVELCVYGRWKTVCDNNWSVNEARVVCSQLGFENQGDSYTFHCHLLFQLS